MIRHQRAPAAWNGKKGKGAEGTAVFMAADGFAQHTLRRTKLLDVPHHQHPARHIDELLGLRPRGILS